MKKLREELSGTSHSSGNVNMDGWRDRWMDACGKIRKVEIGEGKIKR